MLFSFLPGLVFVLPIRAQPRAAVAARQGSVADRLAADLQWTPTERIARFGHMDRSFPTNRIAAGTHTSALPTGPALRLQLAGGLRQRMQHDGLSGLLVLQHGVLRSEFYASGAGPHTRWTSFSVAKSFTSNLVGVEVQRGWIGSVDDPVTKYLPELRNSAYDGVTVRQMLTMSSGVRWTETYDTEDADNVRLYRTPVAPGHNPVLEYMRRLPRAHTPGTVWNYSTGEADLTGVLLRRVSATHGGPATLSGLLSESVWKPAGMQHDAFWIADSGEEFAGSGISATLRDYGRFGLLALQPGNGIVPPGWFATATRKAFDAGPDGRGYGMGWWTFPDGTFAALGIFGQSIWVDPTRDLVVVIVGAWPTATSPALAASRAEIWHAAQAAIDADR